MKWIVSAIIILFCVIGVEVYLIQGIDNDEPVLGEQTENKTFADASEVKKQISPIPIETPTPTPTETPSPTPTIAPTPTITPTPSPTSIPQPQFTSQQINQFIEGFAGQYAVDPNVLRHIATCESGFNPDAVNGPYLGLYQFNATTWRNNRIPMGEDPDPDLRANAEEAVQTAAYLISLGKFYLWPNCTP